MLLDTKVEFGYFVMSIKMRITESELRESIRQEILREFNLMDTAGKLFGGMLEKLKEKLATFIMRLLGINVEGFFSKVVINAVGNLTMSDMKNMAYGDKQITTFVNELLEAMEETLLENIPEVFGISPDGVMTSIMEEAIVNSLVKDKDINKKISNLISKEISNII